MGSLGWTLIQYDWCSYKKGKLDTETDMHRGKMVQNAQGGDGYVTGMKHLQAKECQELPANARS